MIGLYEPEIRCNDGSETIRRATLVIAPSPGPRGRAPRRDDRRGHGALPNLPDRTRPEGTGCAAEARRLGSRDPSVARARVRSGTFALLLLAPFILGGFDVHFMEIPNPGVPVVLDFAVRAPVTTRAMLRLGVVGQSETSVLKHRVVTSHQPYLTEPLLAPKIPSIRSSSR